MAGDYALRLRTAQRVEYAATMGAGRTAGGTVGSSQDVLLVTFVVRMALGVALTSALAHELDKESFGFVAYVGTWLLLLHVLLDAGTGVVATREIAARPAEEQRILGQLLGFRGLSGALAGLALLISAWIETDAARRTVICVTAVLAPLLALGCASVPLQVRQRFRGPAFTGVVSQALVLALLLVLPWGSAALPAACAALLLLLREVMNTGVTVLLARRACGVPRPVFGSELRAFLKLAWPQGRFALLQAAWFHADVFVVRWLCGDAVLAAYAVAYRPVGPLLLIPGMLVLPLIPVLAACPQETARDLVRKLTGILCGLGALGAVCALCSPSALLALLYPADQAEAPESIMALRWMGVAFFLAFTSTPLLSALVAQRHERPLLIVGVGALLLNVLANLAFTQQGGAVSAAAITAATEGLVASGAGVLWWRRCGSPFDGLALAALVPGALLAAVLLSVSLSGWSVLCAAALACGMLFLLPRWRAARRELRALGRWGA